MATEKEINELKEQASVLYKEEKYQEAIEIYVQALSTADDYEEVWLGKMPYKSDFGLAPKIEEGCMFF